MRGEPGIEDGHGRGSSGAPNGPGRVAAGTTDEPSRVPVVSMILMAIFLVGGSIGLLTDWPAGPANLDWGVWIVLYGGYAYVISAAIFHARTGR